MDAKEKKIKLMRYWLFGTFIILFAAISLYFGYIVGTAIFTNMIYWLWIVLAAVLCVIGFYFYKWYLGRK